MAEPQLDPNYDYAKLPDGSYAKFAKGTSKAEVQAKLGAAGLIKPAPLSTASPSPTKRAAMEQRAKGPVGEVFPGSHQPTVGGRQPYLGLTPSNVMDQIGSGAASTYKFGRDVVRDAVGRFPESMMGKDTTYSRFIDKPADAAAAKAAQAPTLSEKAGYYGAAALPGVGPLAAQLGEQAGRGDIGGVAGQLVGMYGATKAGELVIDKATGMVKPESLRMRAAKLDTKVLETARAAAGGKPGLKSYELATAYQVAKEGIIGTLKTLPDKLEAKRMAKDVAVKQKARALDAAGKSVDVEADVSKIAADVAHVTNLRGNLSPKMLEALRGMVRNVMSEYDASTQTWKPRDLRHLSVSSALELQRGLDARAEFGDQVPGPVANLARRIRGAIGDKVGAVDPELQSLRADESKLATARDSARENYTKVLNGGRTVARGFIYSNMPAIAAYLGLKAMGLSFGPAIGGIIVARTLAESTLSRTARAALYAKAADLLDGAVSRAKAPASPQAAPNAGGGLMGPQGGGMAQTGGNAPQVPPQQRLAAAIGPQAAPFAQATVVSQNPASGMDTVPQAAPVTRGTMLPEKATRARAGSGDYVRGQEPKTPAKAPLVSVAQSNTKPQSKAMLDRLDTLLERQAKPKSGADRVAIEREITEVKRILSGDAKGDEVSAINKRIADRERLASKRGEAKASTPGASTGASADTSGTGRTSSEPTTRPDAAPDNRVIILDMGYKKLATYESGPDMVKALQSQAKSMAKAGIRDYDEVSALADALNTMKEIEGK